MEEVKTRLGVIVALCAFAVSAPAAAQDRPAAEYIAAIEGRQDGAGPNDQGEKTILELMDELGVPGVSVAVIKDFEIHWAKGYGIADVETGARVDTETMFQAASISKPVAAMAVLRAVQDGLFTLDTDVNEILTSWTLNGGEFTRDRPVTPRSLTLAHPVEQVTWLDCATWLPRWGLAFPSEAQWEYACRAGAASAFAFGETLKKDQANFWDGKAPPDVTVPVDSNQPNSFGLHNMHGNVWEWCREPLDTGSDLRALRGGSFADPASICRSENRIQQPANHRGGDVGLRPVFLLR